MKKLLFLFALLAMMQLAGLSQEKLSGKYSIKIDATSLPDKPGKLFYSYYNTYTRESFSDSLEVKENELKIKGVLEEPVLMSLRYVSSLEPQLRQVKSGNAFLVYAEPGDIEVLVKDSMSNSIVKGSTTHIEYDKLTNLIRPFNQRQTVLYKEYSDLSAKNDSAGLKTKVEEIDALAAEMVQKVYKPFYKENVAKTPVSLRALRMLPAEKEEDYLEIEALLKLLPSKFHNLPSAKNIANGVEIGRKTAIGAMALEFSQNDTLNNPVKLSSFRGKYVLLDFWASWCGPCRRENPNLVKSFIRYKDKGFTIFSVSLDQPGKKDKWIKAIHDDKMTWTHVSDLKYWANDVAKKYNINSIPASLLIDPQGKIIAKDLRGVELDKKLDEVLGGKLSVENK